MLAWLAVVCAAAFGAADQYLGSFSMHPWMADVSLLSAPWIVLPFLAGSTQARPGRAARLGLATTFAALFGYAAMTLSPIENAQPTMTAIAGFVRSESQVILGAVLTGPLFGWLGCQWRGGAWWAGLLTAAALCLEPAARALYGNPIGSSAVLLAEIAVGVAAAVCLTVVRRPPARRPSA